MTLSVFSLSLWNAMVGCSILAIPWALQEAGYVLGLVCIVFVCFIALYTVLLTIRNGQGGMSESRV